MSNLTKQSKAYKPFRYPWAVELTRGHEEIHWTEDEAKLGDDIVCWNLRLSEEERQFYRNCLLLFTESDKQVAANYVNALIPSVQNNEIRSMLLSFAGREGTHQRAYALMNETLGLDDNFYSEFLEYKSMAAKISFLQEDDISTLGGRALAFARSVFAEGGFLFTQFAALMNAQRKGKMIGFGTINDWSIRDETLHVEGNSMVFRTFMSEFPHLNNSGMRAEIDRMSKELVRLEDNYTDTLFGSSMAAAVDDLRAADMKQFMRFVVDQRRGQLGYPPIFKVSNPLPWTSHVFSGSSVTNFFERRVTDYSVAGLQGEMKFGEIALPRNSGGRYG